MPKTASPNLRSGLLPAPIAEKAAVVFTRTAGPTVGSYDPLTDQRLAGTSGSVTTAKSTAIAIQPTPTDRTRYEAHGWLVQHTIELEVEAWPLGSFVPAVTDQLVWSGLTYTVQEYETIAPAGVVRSYRVVATR